MIYKKAQLVRILNEAMLATSKTKHVPMYSCVYFKDGMIYAQNGRMFYQRRFESDLNLLVPAYKLRAIIAKMGEEISLTHKNKSLIIESDNNITKLNSLETPRKYSIPSFDGHSTFYAPDRLIEAIEATLPFVSLDLTDTTILGVHLNGGNAYTTDRKRATMVPVTEEDSFPTEPVTVTREACMALYQIGPPDKITFSDTNIIFKYEEEDKIIVSSLVDMPFPQVAIDATKASVDDRKKVVFPDDITLPILRVSRTIPIEEPAIRVMSNGTGTLYLSSESAAVGSSEEVLSINSNVEFEFLINPRYLLDIFRFCKTMYYKTADKPLIFQENSFTCYIAPILPKEE